MEFLYYMIAGAGVGIAIGMTGIGGGSLMTPLLIMFGFPYHIAIGTDLLYAAITKASGVVTHQRRKNINWRLVGLLAAGSIPAAMITALFLKNVFGDPEAYRPILTTALGITLILTALVLIFKRQLQRHRHEAPLALEREARAHAAPATVIMGLILGVFVTLSSVGAGAIGTAVIMMLYPALASVRVVGTDLAHAVPLTLVAGLSHVFFLGNVDWLLLAALLAGSLPAIHLGAALSSKMPERLLQSILASCLLGLGVKFAFF